MIFTDREEFGKLHAVGAGLIEHDEKLAVGKHGSRRMGLQKVLHVLRQSRTAGSIFSDTFPERKEEIRAVFVLKQEVNFIYIDPRVFSQSAISDDAVEDAVQHDEHSHGEKLLSEVADVVA